MRGGAVGVLCLVVACSTSGENDPGTTGVSGGGSTAEGGSGAQAAGSTGGQGGGGGSGGTGAAGGGGGAPVECDGADFARIPVAIPTCDGLGPGTEDCH